MALPVIPKFAIGGRHRIAATRAIPGFWATICKTVRPMLSDCCLVCPVCNVGALWPNGWMDQDASWHRGRSRPRRHCVRWGHSFPQRKGAQQPPVFGLCLLWPNNRPSQLLLSSCTSLTKAQTLTVTPVVPHQLRIQ